MIRALLRLYPREWRERYGDEVVDLVDVHGGLGFHSGVDLVVQALRVRAARRVPRLVGGPVGDVNGPRPTPWLAMLGALALLPAAILGVFGMLFTLLGVAVDPFVPIVRAAFDVLPMAHATSVLPLLSLLAAAMSLAIRRPTRPPDNVLARAWCASRIAVVVFCASSVPLGFWVVGNVSWLVFSLS